jgi:ketosteroid isomerase-like protein
MDARGPEEVGRFFQAVAEYGFVHAWTVRDGKLARFDEFVAPSGALVAQ